MDRFEGMRIFAAVAHARSFAHAARALGLSAPAVSRAVVALEAHLGAQLLRRTTRSVTLTDAGARFHADCTRILADVASAEAEATGASTRPQGELTVTAPRMFGRLHVAPLLVEFLARHPSITARAIFADHIVHLLDDGFDVAVRIAHLPDSGLTALRVGHVRRVVVAAPAYVKAYGAPRTPADLEQHTTIGYAAGGTPSPAWEFRAAGRADAAGACSSPRAPAFSPTATRRRSPPPAPATASPAPSPTKSPRTSRRAASASCSRASSRRRFPFSSSTPAARARRPRSAPSSSSRPIVSVAKGPALTASTGRGWWVATPAEPRLDLRARSAAERERAGG